MGGKASSYDTTLSFYVFGLRYSKELVPVS